MISDTVPSHLIEKYENSLAGIYYRDENVLKVFSNLSSPSVLTYIEEALTFDIISIENSLMLFIEQKKCIKWIKKKFLI